MSEAKPKIGIVISSTREGRFGEKPALWIHDLAATRGDFDVELIDLRDYPMPFFEEPVSPAYAPPANEVARYWAAKVDSGRLHLRDGRIQPRADRGAEERPGLRLSRIQPQARSVCGLWRGRRCPRDRTAAADQCGAADGAHALRGAHRR